MAPPTKKQINKGFHGFQTDDAEFLTPCNPVPDRGNFDAAASGVGYNARWDDDRGYARGSAYGFSDAIDRDLALRNQLPDESVDTSHERLSGLIDNQVDQPADELLGGGGPVSDNKRGGVGRGGPKYAPKTGPRTNARSR